jgi:hypothetical protein
MIQDKYGLAHAIPIQSGGIALRLKVEDFGQHNLLNFLNLFGKLYYGTVNAEYFDRLFQTKKQQFLEQLKLSTVSQDLEFQLQMTRVALTNSWKWPAFVNVVQHNGDPEWATGGSRILASGLCKKNPQTTVSVLFFDQIGTNVGDWLDCPTLVTDDQQLHKLLGITHNPGQSPLIHMCAVLRQVDQQTRLLLHGIIDEELDGYQNSQELSELTLLNSRCQWPVDNCPELKIYTDWPELVSDSLGVWNYSIAGNISQFAHQLDKPGHLEKLARLNQTSTGWALYVKQPHTIDLSEFLVWLDTQHTAYIDQNWNFLLHQHGSGYKSTMIALSSTQHK